LIRDIKALDLSAYDLVISDSSPTGNFNEHSLQSLAPKSSAPQEPHEIVRDFIPETNGISERAIKKFYSMIKSAPDGSKLDSIKWDPGIEGRLCFTSSNGADSTTVDHDVTSSLTHPSTTKKREQPEDMPALKKS
jgi:hypothetical protein